jgi:ABC-2 type transport system ATP-binding protein
VFVVGDYIISVEGLVKRFKDVVAVDNISFKVRRGEIYGLLGPNGAGKTTTINILITLLKPTSGKAFIDGIDVVEEPDKVRKKIGVVFQDPTLDNFLTAYENLYIHGRIYGLSGRELDERIKEALEFVELRQYANKVVRYFSGGMRRRLEIARALLHEPEILFLDEPTIGLDPQSRNKVWEYVGSVRREKGVTIFMTTHYMDEAEFLCDRIAVMDHGKIIAEGSPEELKSMVGSDIIIMKFNDSQRAVCLEDSLNGVIRSCRPISGNRIELVVTDAVKVLPKIFEVFERRGAVIDEVSYRRPTLNEVFLYLTGRELRDSLEESPRPTRRW